MKVLIQRVLSASVHIDGVSVGQISQGLLLLIGFEKNDTPDMLNKMCDKILKYRLFADENQKMNCNVQDVSGGILAVSQFTLAANTKQGLRPGFSSAAAPDLAKTYYDDFVTLLQKNHNGDVEQGQFGADMKVSLVNDGPVTFMLEL